jgi:hypothetical protein
MDHLDRIAEAASVAESRMPSTVIDAFAPELPEVAGLRLAPMNAAAWLIFEKLSHPIILGEATAATMTTFEFVSALYVLAKPTRETLRLIREGELEGAIMEFAEGIPLHDEKSVGVLVDHIVRAFSPALPMRSPHDGGQKKTAASEPS